MEDATIYSVITLADAVPWLLAGLLLGLFFTLVAGAVRWVVRGFLVGADIKT